MFFLFAGFRSLWCSVPGPRDYKSGRGQPHLLPVCWCCSCCSMMMVMVMVMSPHWHGLLGELLLAAIKFGESLGGSQAPPSFWKVPGLPRKFPKLPGSFSATSPEVLSLWNLTAIQGFPGSFPDFPGSSPDFPGSFPDFPGGQPLSLGSLTPSPDSQAPMPPPSKNANFIFIVVSPSLIRF